MCASSCGSKSESSDGSCAPGTAFCPCDNGGCGSGLICATNLDECVQPVTSGSGGATGAGGTSATGGVKGSGGSASGGTTGNGGSVASGGATGKGGASGTGGTTGTGGAKGGTTGTGGSTGTGGAKGGTTGTGGSTGTGGASTGGSTGSGGSGSTNCGTLGPTANGSGSFTHYNFGQGTAKGELGDYQTACGYLGTEGGNSIDTVMNIANTSPAKNTYFAAIPGDGSFNTSGNCGACVQITGQNGKTIVATIIDECPEASNPICQQNPSGELDLSVDAFNQLGYSTGNPSGTSWKVVPCPASGNVVVRIKQSNELYIENVILPIKTASGPGGNASRTSYGSWHFNSNVGSGTQLTLTDSAGRMISVTLNSGSVDQNQDTGKQFPTCQ